MNNKEQEYHNCSICGAGFYGWGHNPQPVKKDVDARCCGFCNSMVVIPSRLDMMLDGRRQTA